MAAKKGTHKRIAPIREGLAYQDIVALNLLVDWLYSGGKYQWMEVEADDAGALDDIVIMRADNQIEVVQVKYAAHPEAPDDPWTFENLTEQATGRNGNPLPSLLQKWATSLSDLQAKHTVADARVVSNRQPAADLEAALSKDGYVDLDKIEPSETRNVVVDQLGGDKAAQTFFDEFRFSLSRPGLDELEEASWRRIRELHTTHSQWLNLKDSFRSWVGRLDRPTSDGRIRLRDVREAAQWNQLKPLYQAYTIPEDFVVPSEGWEKTVMEQITTMSSGCIVIEGRPGTGKSTYASHLYRNFREQDLPVVRHHYALAASLHSEYDQHGRVEHIVAAESLMHDIQRDYAHALGDAASTNPQPLDIRRWVEACGHHYSKEGLPFILIIDGLDHVWREKRSMEELNTLFSLLLPAPVGVIVLVLTQPLQDDRIPNSLLTCSPREEWHEMPYLDEAAVDRWVENNIQAMRMGEESQVSEHYLGELSNAFYEKSNGHPLYLRYALNHLLAQKDYVTRQDIEALPEISDDDITTYYDQLWRHLSEDAREILHLFASSRFTWQRGDLLDCLDPDGNHRASKRDALAEVQHLLIEDENGLQPFHSSFNIFVRELDEHADYAQTLREKTLAWLKDKAPAYLKWAHEWTLEAELGNIEPLVKGINRDWAVDAVAKRRSWADVSRIITAAIDNSLTPEYLCHALEQASAYSYAEWAYNALAVTRQILLYAQLHSIQDERMHPRLLAERKHLTGIELSLVVESMLREGESVEVEALYNEMLERVYHGHLRYADSGLLFDRDRDNLSSILRVASMPGGPDPVTITTWMKANREVHQNKLMLARYTTGLRVFKQAEAFRALMNDESGGLNNDEKAIITAQASLLALEEDLDFDDVLLKSEPQDSGCTAIYAHVLGKEIDFAGARFPDPAFLSTYSSDLNADNFHFPQGYVDCYFAFLANSLWGKASENQAWLDALENEKWSQQFVRRLSVIAESIAQLILAGQPVPYSAIYAGLADLEPLGFPTAGQHHIWGHEDASQFAVAIISQDMFVISKALGGTDSISEDALADILHSKFFRWDAWEKTYVDHRRAWLSDAALEHLLSTRTELLDSSIEYFSERADAFALLANIPALHGWHDKSRGLIEATAENLVAHGMRKDTLLLDTVEVIQMLHAKVPTEALEPELPEPRDFLLDLAPYIAHIHDFTDGDGTRHSPYYFADALIEIEASLFPAWLEGQSKDDLWQYLGKFVRSLIQKGDLSSPAVREFLDKKKLQPKELQLLKERADSGDKPAEAILKAHLDTAGLARMESSKKQGNHQLEAKPENNSDRRPHDIDVSKYLPTELDQLRQAMEDAGIIFGREVIGDWLHHWIDSGESEGLIEAIETTDNRIWPYRGHYNAIFDLMRSRYGTAEAYPWLVEGQQADSGWFGPTSDETFDSRVERILEHYPDKWFDFIKDTVGGVGYGSGYTLDHGSWNRIIRYCLLVEQYSLAHELAVCMTAIAKEYLSPINFQTPPWVPASDEGD